MELNYYKTIFLLLPTLALADSSEVELCNISESKSSFYTESSSGRITPYSRAGEVITFKLPTDFSDNDKVTVSEAARLSRLSEDISKIIDATPSVKLKAASSQPTFKCVHYTQKNERSRITITTSHIENNTTVQDKKKTFIAGPIDHWYLSADMPITKAKQLTYDTKNNTFDTKDVPQSFYLGINYKLGDVYTTSDYLDHSYENLSIKILAKVSAPSESYGLGLGYDFGPAVIFAARINTKNDSSASGAPTNDTLSTVYGVSFDIEKGISWLSGK